MHKIEPSRRKREFKTYDKIVRAGRWGPFMFDLQYEIYYCKKRAILVSGPRLAGKTWATLNRLVKHAWETPPDPREGGVKGARIAMFSRTIKNSKDGGTWQDMQRIVIPEWTDGLPGFGFTTVNAEGVPGAKTDGQTRTPFFRTSTMHEGGEAEFLLFSLDHDDDIEAKIKEQRFSAIYFSELDKFRDRKVFSISLQQLRLPHLGMDEMFWAADTNPSEEGEESWIYDLWYRERIVEYDDYVNLCRKQFREPLSGAAFVHFQQGLSVFELRPEQNPFLDPRQLLELEHTYAYDADLFDRYVRGKWVKGKGARARHFNGYFFPNIHVKGDCGGAIEDEWIVLNPAPSCFEVITGWDLGDRNHSAHIIEKVGEKEKTIYKVLDEHVSIDQDVSIFDFVRGSEGKPGLMHKLERLDRHLDRKLLTNRNWSDRSSMERYSAIADTYEHLEVFIASGKRIPLQGVPKGPGSVQQRVRMLKRLLVEGRIFISAHCFKTIEMIEKLRRGDEDEYVVSDQHKHPFDSLTYPLLMETAFDHEDQANETDTTGPHGGLGTI